MQRTLHVERLRESLILAKGLKRPDILRNLRENVNNAKAINLKTRPFGGPS